MDFTEEYNLINELEMLGFTVGKVIKPIVQETHYIKLDNKKEEKDLFKVLSGKINDLNLELTLDRRKAFITYKEVA